MPWNGELTILNSLNGQCAVLEFSQMGISGLKEMVNEWRIKTNKQAENQKTNTNTNKKELPAYIGFFFIF